MKKSDGKPVDTIDWNGFKIMVENKPGSKRVWHDRLSGASGMKTMKYPYGYFSGIKGMDGDSLDVFVLPDEHEKTIYVVKQLVPLTGQVDEEKVIVGAESKKRAKLCFEQHNPNPKAFGGIETYSINEFKKKYSDNIKKAEALSQGYDPNTPLNLDLNNIETVQFLLQSLDSFGEDQIVQVYKEIWGQENLSTQDTESLLNEIQGFLTDQMQLLELGIQAQQEQMQNLQERSLSWKPRTRNLVNGLRSQFGLSRLG